MAQKSDHDLLIEINTHVKYIRRTLCEHNKAIKRATKERQDLRDWQEKMDTRIGVFVGLASFIGGAIVFIVNKAWDWFDK